MTMGTVCLFHKFGFCKFRETCRKIHYEETCEVENCESESCAKRHPRTCKYFNIHQRCKFGTFCFFAQRSVLALNNNEDKEMKTKIATLEDEARKLKDEIKSINNKFKKVEDENRNLEISLNQQLKV